MSAPSSGGIPFKLISAATTNATSVKAAPGQVLTLTVGNINAAVRYIKLYNLATAPTVGTTVPVFTMPIPAASFSPISINFGPDGMYFSAGIALALTTGMADADTGAVALAEQAVNLTYL
ncbi:MAG TPA: hypothetical protein PLJ74_05425 [Myxococcota bacterium]|nr:hypothetical protein [Myxococcota bacterium]